MASSVVLILGAGPRIGKSVAQSFANAGFKVAIASRTLTAFENDKSGNLLIKADLADPTSIKPLFDEVKAKLGVPNVVVYNGAAATFAPNPFAAGVEGFSKNLHVNVTSLFASAHEAVAGFDTLPADTPRNFIFTGNRFAWNPLPFATDLSVGKAAAANLIENLAKTYAAKNYGFYFADERQADGNTPGQNVNAENHGKFYLELGQGKEQGPWKATFVGDKHVAFEK